MRRRLWLIAIAGAFTLALIPHGAPAVAALRASGRTVASEITHSMPAFTVGELRTQSGGLVSASSVGSTGGETLSVTSPAIDAGQLFERVGVHFRIADNSALDSVFVELRTSPDGARWGDWQQYAVDEDMGNEAAREWYIAPQVAPPDSRYAQYRVWLTGGDPALLEQIALTFLDVNDLNAGPLARLQNDIGGALTDIARSFGAEGGTALAAPTGASKILTRQDWGADESLMKWTPKYVPVQKVVVHHTVTSDGGTNVAAELRSIYYYHAVTRGWGDIGYSFVVDKYGNIWTGRQGGDNTVAGHAYGWNDGTIGIAALGDYSVTPPTGQLQGAIANVIALKFKQLGIQPYGNGAYTHEEQQRDGSWIKVTTTVANVLGHRDCNYVVGQTGGQTACPGGSLYNMLPGLRSLAQTAWTNGYTYLAKLDPQLAAAGIPGQGTQVAVRVANLGSVTIPAGTSVNYRVLRNGAVVTQGAGAPLTAPVAPGGSTTLNVPFIAPSIGEYLIRWDLQTSGAWWNALYNSPVRDQWFRSADWSADWLSDTVTRNWTAGEIRMIAVTVRNDGGRTWPAGGTNPVRIGYYWISTATGNRFDGVSKMPLPYDVVPGAQITVTMPIVAPAYPTNYTMILDLYKENEFWFRDKGLAPDDTETTVGVDFKAQYTAGALPSFAAGKAVTVPIVVANLGRGTFPVTNSYPVNLGYHWYDQLGKVVTWDGARTKLPADLLTGQSVTLSATVTPPDKGGTYDLRFDLVQEGIGWFSDKGVNPTRLLAAVAGPVIPVYAAVYQPAVSILAQSGGVTTVPFTVTNTSNFTWTAAGTNPVTLSYHWISSSGATVVWDGARTKLPADLPPGQSVTLQANVVFPQAQGTYTLRWDLVHEGLAWFSSKGVATLNQAVVVGPPPFYGGSMDVSKVPASLPVRMTTTVPLRVQNMSNFVWGADVNLAYHWYDSAGKVVVWDGVRTALAGMQPNEVRSVSAALQGPDVAGAYTLRFDVVQEGVTWFSGKGMLLAPIAESVSVPQYGALYGEPATATGAANASITVPVAITNVGSLAWTPGTFNVAYHLYTSAGALLVWDGARTALAAPVAAGQSALVNATVRLPAVPGAFVIRWDVVQEGVTWFSGQGVPADTTALTVQ